MVIAKSIGGKADSFVHAAEVEVNSMIPPTAADSLLDDSLLESLGLESLVPASLASWRPLVSQGMKFFLERLPQPRLNAIVAAQLALPQDAGVSARLLALAHECVTLHKLGQVLARNRQIDQTIRHHLQSLESMPPTTPIEQVLRRIDKELPHRPPVAIAQNALAEGSVAVILPFRYQDKGKTHDGVFKVLKPGIEEKFNEEILIWLELGRFLEQLGKTLGLPALDYRSTLDSVRELLVKEIHLEEEQKNLRAAAAMYADEPHVLIPRLLPWCTPKVTAMERIFGTKVADASLPSWRRTELANSMIAALVGQPFWSRAEQAMFHADLHAGNLFLCTDGRLAILDWSLTLRLSKSEREILVSLILGGLTLDAARIRSAISALGSISPDDPILVEAVERALDRMVYQGCLPGFEWTLELLDGLALDVAAGFHEDFVLFRKTWFSLSGLIHDLGGGSPDWPLAVLGLRRFFAELPSRALARPDAADFSTHVSNAEVMRAFSSLGLIAMRYWERRMKLEPHESESILIGICGS